jgi:hypothetical protein
MERIEYFDGVVTIFNLRRYNAIKMRYLNGRVLRHSRIWRKIITEPCCSDAVLS